MRVIFAILITALVSGCYEPASKWDDRAGRFRWTGDIEQERRDEIRSLEKRIDQLERERR